MKCTRFVLLISIVLLHGCIDIEDNGTEAMKDSTEFTRTSGEINRGDWHVSTISSANESWFTDSALVLDDSIYMAYCKKSYPKSDQYNLVISVGSVAAASRYEEVGNYIIESSTSPMSASIASVDDTVYVLFNGKNEGVWLGQYDTQGSDNADDWQVKQILSDLTINSMLSFICVDNYAFASFYSFPDQSVIMAYSNVNAGAFEWKEICIYPEALWDPASFYTQTSIASSDDKLLVFYNRADNENAIDLYCAIVDIASVPYVLRHDLIYDGKSNCSWSSASADSDHVYATFRDKSQLSLYLVWISTDLLTTDSTWEIVCIDQSQVGGSSVRAESNDTCIVAYHDLSENAVWLAYVPMQLPANEVQFERVYDSSQRHGKGIRSLESSDMDIVVFGQGLVDGELMLATRPFVDQ